MFCTIIVNYGPETLLITCKNMLPHLPESLSSETKSNERGTTGRV